MSWSMTRTDQNAENTEFPASSFAENGSLNPEYPTIIIAPARENIGLHKKGIAQCGYPNNFHTESCSSVPTKKPIPDFMLFIIFLILIVLNCYTNTYDEPVHTGTIKKFLFEAGVYT